SPSASGYLPRSSPSFFAMSASSARTVVGTGSFATSPRRLGRAPSTSVPGSWTTVGGSTSLSSIPRARLMFWKNFTVSGCLTSSKRTDTLNPRWQGARLRWLPCILLVWCCTLLATGPDFGRGLLLATGTWSCYGWIRSKERNQMSYDYVAEFLYENRMGETP